MKQSLEKVIGYANKIKKRDKDLKEKQAKVSAIRSAVKLDLEEMYHLLTKQINGTQDTTNAVLTNVDKVLKEVEESKVITKDIASKVGKVTDVINKITTKTVTYWDAVLANPRQTNSNRTVADPKILSDMDHQVKQILIEIYNVKGNNTLAKSLTELVNKANKALMTITDTNNVTLLGHFFLFLYLFIPVFLLHPSHACVALRPLGLASSFLIAPVLLFTWH